MEECVGARSGSKQTLDTYNTLDVSVEVVFCDDSNDVQGNTQAVDTATILTTTLGIMALFINKQTNSPTHFWSNLFYL